MTFRASILTLYPDMFPGPLGASLAGKALQDGVWSLEATNIRDFATDKHRSVDDTPAGGGAGMVLRPDVLASLQRRAVPVLEVSPFRADPSEPAYFFAADAFFVPFSGFDAVERGGPVVKVWDLAKVRPSS